MNTEDFRLLYDYNAWADRRTLDACAGLSAEQFTAEVVSSFRSVRNTLVHIMLVEWLWLERWHGRSPSAYPPVTEFPSLDSLRARWAKIERDLVDYVASLTPEDLQRVVQHKTTAGVAQAAPLWQMLQHLVNHGTYHRGQVTTLLRQLGAKPSTTDLIFFYRERAAQATAKA
ncbi:MAG: DinB family protein [Candidatus Acidiferrales bacterium]